MTIVFLFFFANWKKINARKDSLLIATFNVNIRCTRQLSGITATTTTVVSPLTSYYQSRPS